MKWQTQLFKHKFSKTTQDKVERGPLGSCIPKRSRDHGFLPHTSFVIEWVGSYRRGGNQLTLSQIGRNEKGTDNSRNLKGSGQFWWFQGGWEKREKELKFILSNFTLGDGGDDRNGKIRREIETQIIVVFVSLLEIHH